MTPPSGWRRLVFPEGWPAGVRAAIIITLATVAIYAGAGRYPLVADTSATLMDRSPAPSAWPGVNLSSGLDRFPGADGVAATHAAGFILHVVAGWLLFELLFRVTGRATPGKISRDGFWPALGGALFWTVHPLQTQTVLQASQRGELLGAILLFLTLASFVRATEGKRARAWAAVAVSACALGMATNPILAATPLLALLLDRAFLAGSFRAAWQLHRGLHLGLAATWAVMLYVVSNNGRSGGPVDHLSVQGLWPQVAAHGRATAHLVKLAIWPDPLVFDYGPSAMVSEPRMYIPLACLAAMAALAARACGGRRALIGAAVLIVAAGSAAWKRTSDYRSALSLWSDTVGKAPANERAHFHLGNALVAAGRTQEAVARYETALRLRPGFTAAHLHLADALLQLGRGDEAVSHYEEALRQQPGSAVAHLNLAATLVRVGRMQDADQHFAAALRLGMMPAVGRRQLGRALAEVGRVEEALVHLDEAVRLEPADAATRVVLGMVLSAVGRPADGLRQLFEAVRLQPDSFEAHASLGDALLDELRPAEALPHFEAALRLQPGRAATVHRSMGQAFALLGRVAESVGHYETALRLNPADAEARAKLDQIQDAARRHAEKKK